MNIQTESPAPFVLRDGHALVLRTCAADLTSYGGFQWPESGVVKAPDWNTRAACGNGLHGLLWGIGDGSLLNWDADARWLVVDVVVDDVVEIGGKVKFPRCEVVFCGAKDGAVAMLIAHGADSSRVVGSTITGGDRSTITGGYRSTITGGDGSTITGGYRSTITGGDDSTITGGYRSTITGGDRSTITGGDDSTITGGDRSTITGGDRSTITGGDDSTITGGYGSTITGGYRSTITGGYRSTITGGDDSTITGGYGSTITGGYRSTITGGANATMAIRSWDEKHQRRRFTIGYIGEDGLEPGVAYRLDGEGKFVRADGGAK